MAHSYQGNGTVFGASALILREAHLFILYMVFTWGLILEVF
jgi:hypothetical protein